MSLHRLAGVFSVLPTVFHADGGLDLAGTAAVTHATVEAGVAGVTALGVMGEAAELDEAERRAVTSAVLEAAGDVPVILGVTGPSAELVATRATDAAAAGAGALMVSPTPTLDLGSAVTAAAEGGLPIVVQDYPAGSGVMLTATDLASAAASEPLVIGVKAEAPPTSETIHVLRAERPSLGVVGGLGGLFLIDELHAGATGTMTGFALPASLVSIVTAFGDDPEGAESAWAALLPLMRFEGFPPFSLAARKEVWRLRGVIGSARCRRAGAGLDDRSRADVRRALERVSVTA
ncbi:MAG TPA: dihydrodipicolinate synthase family protein [Candidatus Limnocylindrales bacterium]